MAAAPCLEDTGVALALREAEMERRVGARLPGVPLHDAGNAAVGSTGLAVGIGHIEGAPLSAAVASAGLVFVGRVEDVTGFMCEDTVDVVGAPAIVVVVHNQTRATD